MFSRKLSTAALTLLVLGLLWFLMSDVLSGASREGDGLPADLVVDGQAVADKAAFFGAFGNSAGVSVEALVQALGGTVEPAGEHRLITVGGKKLLFYSGTPPTVDDPQTVIVNELTHRTTPQLGWYWTTAEIKSYLKLVYPDPLVATAFDREKREGRGVYVETVSTTR